MHGLCIGIRLKQPETFPSVFGVRKPYLLHLSRVALSALLAPQPYPGHKPENLTEARKP